MDDPGAISEVLDDRPELKSTLRAVLDIDRRYDVWTFDDVPVDSGAFGELVSHGIVTDTNDGEGYRLADPTAVRAALKGEETTSPSSSQETASPGLGIDSIGVFDRLSIDDRSGVAVLAVSLVVLAIARSFVYPAVFRDGVVLLSANDPYYYRYYAELLTSGQHGLLDLPSSVTTGEPLTIVLLAVGGHILGSGEIGVGTALAVYPVVLATVTGLLVYLLACCVTEDKRIGVASVLFLAFTPGHALRTSLGFADHHAFDFFWLALTALAAVTAVTSTGRSRRVWLASIGVGVGVAGQLLAWDAGPVLVAPLAFVLIGGVSVCVIQEEQSRSAYGPLVSGFAVAAVLVGIVHLGFGWQNTLVAVTPAALVVGGLSLVGLGELWVSREYPPIYFAFVSVAGLVGGVAVVITVTSLRTTIATRAGDLFLQGNIAETASLFSGSSLGVILLLGLLLPVGVPILMMATIAALRGERQWLVVVMYTWIMLLLTMIQVRFVGELAIFLSILTAVGFVRIGEWVDITDRTPRIGSDDSTASEVDEPGRGKGAARLPIPDRSSAISWFLLFLLVGGLGMIQTPVKTSQLPVDDASFETSMAIAEHSRTTDLSYPGGNYVLSAWSDNRMYNYFVNGQSKSYGFAQKYYEPFLRETNSGEAYDRFDYRVGYVVTSDRFDGIDDRQSMQTRLHDYYGSRRDGVDGVGRYRLVSTAGNGSVKAFQLVPGAVIAADAPGADRVTVLTNVTIDSTTFTYRRTDVPDGTDYYRIVVPYPGTYTIRAGDNSRTIEVTEEEVQSNKYVS